MNLSKHEKTVIRCLLEDGKMSDKDIAKRMNITSQAVGKIRKKLETNKVINRYEASINYDEININAFAIILAKLTSDGWKYKGGIGVQEKIAANPNIVAIYRVQEGQITHIIHCAFRNLKELDKYMHVLQSQYSDYLEIIKTYAFSNSSIIKDSPSELICKLLDEDEQERMPEPLLFGKMVGDE